jgi:hypothetical protein
VSKKKGNKMEEAPEVEEIAPAPVEVQTAFFVVVDATGVITVHTQNIPAVTMQREATLYDIETYGSQLVRNVSRVLTVQTMGAILAPKPEPTVADRVADALRDRQPED